MTNPTAVGGSGARLREVIEHSPSSIFVKDLEGRYLLVNEQWSRVSGISAHDAIGRTTAECWPQEAESIAAGERAVTEQGVPLTRDEQMHTVDGLRDFIVVRFCLTDSGGRPTAIVGIATEITERKRIERELAAKERLLEAVMKASPDIITVLGRNSEIRQVSEAGRKILGRNPHAASIQEMWTTVHPEDREILAGSFAGLLDGSTERAQMRFRVRHADGHWVTVDSSAQALIDDSGSFAGAVVVTRDVTAGLAAQKRVRDARGAAETASAAKSEFLSRMSHELRTPLNSVLGFAQLLQMDPLPPEEADAVDHILAAGRHLLDLIDEVLDIARIESGRLELDMSSVPVAEVVGDAIELTRPLAGRTGVSLHDEIDPQCDLAVRADRQRLLQVLLNLLSNAVKYNHPGGRVENTCVQAGPGRLRVSVTDTGRGVKAEDLDRVFEPFDRLGAELIGPEGTGVGLSLSRQLVEHMGGSIGLTSEFKSGSTFFVELDEALADTATDSKDAGGGGEGARGEPGSRGAFRVLLVEEDLASLDLVEQVLKRRPGSEVIAAMHAGLGVELAREHQPDLILLELSLEDTVGPRVPGVPGVPGVTGGPGSSASSGSPASSGRSSVLDLLAADPETSHIPVAVIGAQPVVQQVRDLLGRGVVGLLTKPIDVRGLLSVVDAVRSVRPG